ncbi:PadR family transcriptional regulator [Solibacillus silvestris]|uniref:PadR family transcriptional regulator n=1 Tax=Solibacillus silvestris TaxID=76853 RepID=UPI003F8146CD
MTQLLVLGALNLQPMSGYDIQTMLQVNEAERWSGVQVGSIYHALKKLEKDNYIEVYKIENVGHRQKVIYKITDLGKEHLKLLTFNAIQSSQVPYPLSLYAGLSFIENLPNEQAEKALEEQLAMLEKELNIITCGMEVKRQYINEDLSPLINLVSQNMIDIIQHQILFVKEVLTTVK